MFKRLIFIKNIKYLSKSKIFNFFKLQLSYIFSTHKNSLKPFFISVEPANFCQLHCPECPTGIIAKKVSSRNILNTEMFGKLINELKNTLIHIIFYFQGEPLLNKQLCELIAYAHKNKIYTSTSTNAQALTKETAEKLVKSGLDKIIISIDGNTQEVYEKYRIGGSLKKATEGIEYIVEWKRRLKSTTPRIEVQFIVFKTNEHQMQEMKKWYKQSGANKLTFKTAQLYDFENGHELLTTKKKYARYEIRKDGKYHIKSKLRNKCWRLWSGAVVNVNGDVLPCCFDKNASYAFGNINEQSFAECWHNEKASDFRNKILENRKQFDICRNCTS